MADTYGPATPRIRRFLVALAALGPVQRQDVAARFARIARTAAFRAADAQLGEAIERSGRSDTRDALAGPLLQLVRPTGAPADDEDALDPVAEPALAALLALLVDDLMEAAQTTLLYSAIEPEIPRASLHVGNGTVS